MTTQTTGTDPGSKSAAEIEREVQQSRARVEQTLDQIQERLSPGQLIDQAVSYFRDGGGGEFTRNLGESVKQNPLPVALVAAGVGWMMLSGQRHARDDDRGLPYWDDDPDPITDEEYLELVPEAGVGTSGLGGSHSSGWGTHGGATSDPDLEPGIGDRLKESGRATKEKLDDLGDQAREMGDQARQQALRTGRDMADRAYHARKAAGRRGRRVKQTVLQTVNEQPLLLGAIGLAIGAALGAAVPPTETEDRLMGETSNEALRRAKVAAREQAEKARAAADAVVTAAREEAGEQLTPEADGEPASATPDPTRHEHPGAETDRSPGGASSV